MKKIITAISLAFGLIFASAQTTTPATPKKAVEVKKVAKEKAADSKKAVETKKAEVKKVTKEKTRPATQRLGCRSCLLSVIHLFH